MMKMSAELAAMLEASEAARKQRRVVTGETAKQRALRKVGKFVLRKIDGRKPQPQFNSQIPAESCGVNGLRPTWHGRAS